MNRKGITLIELLVALSVSGILVAGVYKTFVAQQHTFTVQEQVLDMQQNVRLSITGMTRELRMAGFGGGGSSGWDATEFFKHGAIHGAYTGVVNPVGTTSVTVLEGFEPLVRTTMSDPAAANINTISVGGDASAIFDQPPNPKIYISVNGTEAHHITSVVFDSGQNKTNITFAGWDKLVADHQQGEPVYVIAAVTYSVGIFDGKSCLLRDDHLGSGPQPMADNIESLQFEYFDVNGNVTAVPADIRMIRVTVVAMPDHADKDLSSSRRRVTTNLQLRNLIF